MPVFLRAADINEADEKVFNLNPPIHDANTTTNTNN